MNKFVRIGRYVLDVALTEDHTFEADITDFPVESSGSVSDNIRPKPVKIRIEGIVSDTPLSGNGKNAPIVLGDPFAVGNDKIDVDAITGADALKKDVDTISGADPNNSTTLPPRLADVDFTTLTQVRYLRSEEAFNYLKWIWENKVDVTVSTSLGTWDNMAMASFNVPRSKDVGAGLKFTCEFKQIKKVTNGRIRDKTSIRNGGKHKNKGTGIIKNEWFINEVSWRKANPPGSKNIYETEQVRWYWKPSASVGPTPISSSSTDNAASAKVRNSYINDTHKWYHWSGTKGVPNPQPLTDDELAAFDKDYARDKADQALLGNDLYYKGYTRDIAKPGDLNNDPYFPKHASSDLGAQNRKAIEQQSGAPNFSGDPNFQNRANYLRTDGSSSVPLKPKTSFNNSGNIVQKRGKLPGR